MEMEMNLNVGEMVLSFEKWKLKLGKWEMNDELKNKTNN